MLQHDAIAALGHDRQLCARFVRPHAKAKKTKAELGADFLHLLQMAAGFGAGLVQVFKWRAGKFKLSGGFQADIAIRTTERDDIVAFHNGFPAIAGHRHQKIADATGFVIGRRTMVSGAVHELFVLRPDPPAGRRLFSFGEHADQISAVLDWRVKCAALRLRAHARPLRTDRFDVKRKSTTCRSRRVAGWLSAPVGWGGASHSAVV